MHHLSNMLEVIQQYKNKKFIWGQSDCCLFVCDCVKAQTNIDPALPYRDKYSTEAGAKKLLIELGSIELAFDKYFKRVDINFAQRGDVILCDSENGKMLTLMWSGGALAMTQNGCRVIDNVTKLTAWRVE